jgi:hypothetical protein
MTATLPGTLPGTLPASDALSEATVDSLSELFSRDPEKLSRNDIARMVEELEAQRARFKKAEAEGKAVPKPAKIGLGTPGSSKRRQPAQQPAVIDTEESGI